MELKSTASFKDIDIDAMLEHTSFDDFMKGLYSHRVAQTAIKPEQKSSFESILSQVFQPLGDEDADEGLKLRFDSATEEGPETEDGLDRQM